MSFFLYSPLIIGWILASPSLTIAFLPHKLPDRNRVSVPMPTPLSAVDASANMEAESGNNESMIHYYDSPFSPISSDGQPAPSALIILNTPITNISQL